VKVLAVADAFETLQMATPVRPAFTRWSALEEVEECGKTFAREAVRALTGRGRRPELTAPAAQSVARQLTPGRECGGPERPLATPRDTQLQMRLRSRP